MDSQEPGISLYQSLGRLPVSVGLNDILLQPDTRLVSRREESHSHLFNILHQELDKSSLLSRLRDIVVRPPPPSSPRLVVVVSPIVIVLGHHLSC